MGLATYRSREISIWTAISRSRAAAHAYLPPTTHLSSAENIAAHRRPCAPMQRHLRAQHAQHQQHGSSYLQIARDRDRDREIAILACVHLLPTHRMSAADSTMLHLAHSSAHLRHLRGKHAQPEQNAENYPRPRETAI